MPDLPPDLTFTPLLRLLLGLECLLLLSGCVILARRIRTAPARFLGLAPAGLAPSPYRPSELFLAAAFAFGGAILLQIGATCLAGLFFPKPANGELGLYHIVQSAGFQLGLLAGLAHAWFWHLRPARRDSNPAWRNTLRMPAREDTGGENADTGFEDADTAICAMSGRRWPKKDMFEFEGRWVSVGHKDEFFQRLREGLGQPPQPVPGVQTPVPPVRLRVALLEGGSTFLTLLPIVSLTGFLWKSLLDFLGVKAQPQDLVTLFARTGDFASLAVMIGLAVLVAPVTEELVFRVGLFRWLRTRIPRSLALFLPAVAFAALHGNLAVLVPLVVLAVCLALAYERVGHPLVPMVAHALFNLNTLVLLLAGLPA